MMPNQCGWDRALRMAIGACLIGLGAPVWSGAPDFVALVGVLTFVIGMVGWCPIYDWLGISSPGHERVFAPPSYRARRHRA
jgi:hypothetical protein